RYSWPPFESGNEVGRRHGFFSTPTLREEDAAELAEIEATLWSVVPAATERDGPTIAACAELVWRLRRGYADLHEHGLIREGAPQPRCSATSRRPSARSCATPCSSD